MYLLKLTFSFSILTEIRSSHPEVFLGKGVLKIYSKFTGEHPCRSAISIKLFCNFIEITFRHGCSPVNLQHIFRTPFLNDTSGTLLLRNVIIMNYFLLVEVVDFHNNMIFSTVLKVKVGCLLYFAIDLNLGQDILSDCRSLLLDCGI